MGKKRPSKILFFLFIELSLIILEDIGGENTSITNNMTIRKYMKELDGKDKMR